MSNSTSSAQVLTIYYLSESAVTIELGSIINDELSRQVNNLNTLLHQQPFSGLTTTVPAYATLTVFFDVVTVAESTLPGETCFEKVSGYLQGLNMQGNAGIKNASNTVIIPVCYGDDLGPDLEEVARLHQLDLSEVIKIHSAATYKVYMIGFVPGFAYLGGMDERLSTPRKATPRKAVPTGSVGIAGSQTGVYPMQTPGGWQLIGQTPLKLFDAGRPQPSLLQAGDLVKFKPITREEFKQIEVQ